MTRMTAQDFAPELLELCDFYAHGRISKREFPDRAGRFAAGGVGAMAISSMMRPDHALAQKVGFTDPKITGEYLTYPNPNGHGEVRGHLVRPVEAVAPVGGVVWGHESRG
jgi:carboxymethylenebutenolidase